MLYIFSLVIKIWLVRSVNLFILRNYIVDGEQLQRYTSWTGQTSAYGSTMHEVKRSITPPLSHSLSENVLLRTASI